MFEGSPRPPTSTAPASAYPSAPPSTVGMSTGPHSPGERRLSHTGSNGLNARSCVTCRRRKVKCDKLVPCSNCTKAQTECVFPAPGRAPRRPRTGGKVASEREVELLKRLRRLEAVVEDLSGQVELEAVKHSPGSDHSSIVKDGDSSTDVNGKPNSVRVVGMDEGSGTKKAWMTRTFNLGHGPPKTAFGMSQIEGAVGRLVLDEGKSRYVASPFWADLTEEVEEIRGIIEDHDFESEDETTPILPSDVVTDSNHQSFVMGYNSSDVDLKRLHPLPSQIPFYWQTFLENVHPLVKILHEQTMSKVIKEVQGNLDSLSKSTEALMFSIYFATVTSMNRDEIKTNFGVEKDYLLKQYRFGVEQSLARAGFLNTNEIVTVQAFVLFLVCVRRHDDSRFVWSLTGLVMRIAQSIGLHRDGTEFGLSPFDTEMRRRLWWQVYILEIRAAEDYGSDPSIILDQFSDTKLPLSINDSDLDPDATEPPTIRPGVSEMTFCLIRYEICSLTRKLSRIPSDQTREGAASIQTLEDKEKLIKDCAIHLEEKYLQYCEDAGPLYWVAATIARLVLAKMSLIIYHPLTHPGKPNTLSQETNDRLFMASIEILEYTRVLEAEASSRHWGWLFHTYTQWHAIAYILGELSIRPQSWIVDRAWRVVDGLFNDWGVAVRHSKSHSGMMWRPLRRLMAKARRKREENMQLHQSNATYLGVDRKYVQPSLRGPSDQPGSAPGTISQNPLYAHPTDATSLLSDSQNRIFPAYADDTNMIEPQIVGMGMLAPEQIQLQLQQQQLQQQQTPWLMDDNALLDLDMNGLDEEVKWEGWDDLVRDFQLEVDSQGMDIRRGPTLGGLGSWW